MNEMIERVARAIHEGFFNQDSRVPERYEDCPDYAKHNYRAVALLAIAAMREPTEEMLRAICPPSSELSSEWRGYAENDWHRMIDAALKED